MNPAPLEQCPESGSCSAGNALRISARLRVALVPGTAFQGHSRPRCSSTFRDERTIMRQILPAPPVVTCPERYARMESPLSELLLAGVKLMVIGMGIVYLFLALLVWIIGVTAKLLQRYNPEPDALLVRASQGTEAAEPTEGEVIAVIAAAVQRFRNSHPTRQA